ncbi:CoA-transferase family III [Aspergillus japonicus CBS 114.51]|uniref:CoA-transferase family III n=1 Tax=Aspergillus japonicus CBS 114.51 TaxID=1448312 RepID=A0A8T8WT48_ASPJA|nr:CoA-transferase family III [Aspergillus japonicus CBS 114.51]RAH78834.1 CoA-transferase family III [Aspergillus japonicus CBS 114.51]
MPSASTYSVPKESNQVFETGILNNPLFSHLPPELRKLAQYVQFVGSGQPSIPINWRFAESISALKAFEATMVNHLITRKYQVDPVGVTINTDHASLYYMSPLLAQIVDSDGKPKPISLLDPSMAQLFPEQDKHRATDGDHRRLATNIYKTKDGRFYHIHGSMNPDSTLTALGLPLDGPAEDTYQSAVERLQSAVSQHDSAMLDHLMNEQSRQAGTVAWTSDEYFASEHGRQNSHVGLYEIEKDAHAAQPPSWWPEQPSLPSSPKRPLAGLKVVDLTRVIAAPSITRGLAELGASVMRVTSPHLTDMSVLHPDLNWGKWNCSLHLKEEVDRERLRQLIREADVVVDGYRPGVMDRLGFSRRDVFDLVKDRSYGILHVRENCYGWHGPWSHRSGWQQISDACCGVSMSYGQAMGLNEPVTPVFPNSDYCTGVAGVAAILEALVRRADHGGSYGIDVSLNYYSQWLVRSCGTYDQEVWSELWTRHGSPVFRHYHAMPHLLPEMMKLLHQHDAQTLFHPQFFETRHSAAIGASFRVVKPVAQFGRAAVELGYNVGTRGNGVDLPVWPADLRTEVVR